MKNACILLPAIGLIILCSTEPVLKAEKVVYAAGENNTFIRLRDGVWESVYNEITAADLKCVWESPNREVFAAGSGGVIIHFDGSEWDVMESGSTAELRQIWGTSSEDLFIIGSGGEILHYDGAEWSLQYTAPVPLHAIWGFSGDNIYASGEYAHILHYDGVSWEIVHSSPDSWRTLSVILAWTPDSLNIIGYNNSYYSEEYYNCFHFDGTDWTEIPFERLHSIAGYQNTPPDTVIYYGEGGIALIDRTGDQWIASPCNEPNQLIGASSAWVSREGGLHCIYGNAYFCDMVNGSCTKSGNRLAYHIKAIHGRSDDDVWAVGDDGIVLKFDGQDWNIILGRLLDCCFGGIYGSGPSDIWLAGCYNMLLHFDGESIKMVDFSPSPLSNDYHSINLQRTVDIHGLSASNIVCSAKYPDFVGPFDYLDITIGRFDGSVWSEIDGPSYLSEISKVCNLPGGIVILTGNLWNQVNRTDESMIYRYDGAWSNISLNMCHWYYCDSYHGDFNTHGSIAFTLGYMFNPMSGSGNCIYSVGNTGLPSQYSGALSGTYYGIWGTLVPDHNGITRSNFWLAGANGKINHHIHGVQDTVYSSGTSNTLKAVWGFSRDDIYAVGLGGAIVHFDGEAWSVMESGTSDDLLAVWGADNTVATLLQSFSAELLGDGLLVKWEMAECDPLVEFKLTRKDMSSGSIKYIDNDSVVRIGNLFSYLDDNIIPGNKYRYSVEYLDKGELKFLFDIESPVVPEARIAFKGIFPNPFNPSTTIEYNLPARCHVDLAIYDITGRLVAVLHHGVQDGGIHRLIWDGMTDSGSRVNSGVYLCRLSAGKETISQKVVITR